MTDEEKNAIDHAQKTLRAVKRYDLAALLATPSDKQVAVAYVYEHYKYPQDYTRKVSFEKTAHAYDFVCRALVYAAPPAQSAEQDRIDAEFIGAEWRAIFNEVRTGASFEKFCEWMREEIGASK